MEWIPVLRQRKWGQFTFADVIISSLRGNCRALEVKCSRIAFRLTCLNSIWRETGFSDVWRPRTGELPATSHFRQLARGDPAAR